MSASIPVYARVNKCDKELIIERVKSGEFNTFSDAIRKLVHQALQAGY